MTVYWQKDAETTFNKMIEKIPVFLRALAQDRVCKKAEALAQKENRSEVTEKDMVDAFFSETPFGFHGPMKSDFESLGIDFTKYGYPK